MSLEILVKEAEVKPESQSFNTAIMELETSSETDNNNVPPMIILAQSCPRHIIAASFSKDLYGYNDVKRLITHLSDVLKNDMHLEDDKITICYVGAASNDSIALTKSFGWLLWWLQPKWKLEVLNISDFLNEEKIRTLFKCNVIYIESGNMVNMLKIFRESGFDKTLEGAYENGVILSGVGTGLLCWFKEGIDDSSGKLEVFNDCLGILPFSCVPHYNNKNRKDLFDQAVKESKLREGYGVPDGCIMHFIDEKLHKCISTRKVMEFINNK